MKTTQKVLLALMITSTMFLTGCWVTAKQGTVEYQTIWDKPGQIIRPESGGIYTIFIIGDSYYRVNLTDVTTEPIVVQAQSKDNVRLKLGIQVTYRLKSDDMSIQEHLSQYGLDEKTRDAKFNTVLTGHIQTQARNAIVGYDAYSLMANQGAIQKSISDSLTEILGNQLRQELVSVQITSAPDFDNDNIETAASQVVANQKLKEAADAAQEAAKVETETKKIQAQNFENPKIYALEMQKLRVEEAKAWAGHQGSLIFGGGSSPLIFDVNK